MKKLSILSLSFLAALIPATAFSQVFTVYVIKSAPLAFTDEKGDTKGIHYDFARAIAEASGIEMNVQAENKGVIFRQIKSGAIDAGIFFPNKEWEEFTYNAGYTEVVKLIALNRKGLPLKSYNDLYQSKSIGLMPQMNFGEPFDSDNKLNKNEVRTYEQQIQMLAIGRLDTITGNQLAIFYQLKNNGLSDIVERPGFVFKEIQNQFHLSKKSPHVDKLERIRATIQTLHDNGTLEKILEHYIGKTQ